MAHLNHVEGGVFAPLEYIGITDQHSAAIEYDEFGDDRTQKSIADAEAKVTDIVVELQARHTQDSDVAMTA